MKVLVFGGSGATGKLVVRQLIKKNIEVRLVVRGSSIIEENISNDKLIELIRGNIYDFDLQQVKYLVNDCDGVISCIGHNISFKGIFGPPYKLVSKVLVKIIDALKSQEKRTKLILMSTTAYTNREVDEESSWGEKLVLSLLYLILPPHRDNMLAANHLVYKINSSTKIDWVAVRPDSLIDEENESGYELHNKKIRSPIFNPGKTSRINVSHFIVELLTNEKLWNDWVYKTPVIYNSENSEHLNLLIN